MATKKNLPEIRFKGFEGEWEKVNNNELFKVYPFKPYLTEWTQNDKFEVIQQGDNPIVGFADGKPFENYNGVVLFGDHTLSLYKPTRPFFVASDGLKILGTTNDLNGDYFYTLLQKNKPKSEGYKRHFSILKEITLRITQNVNEQTQIGTYFQHLDSLISLHQRKYDKLLTVKKAMLEEMFPKEGAYVPEIRFKGFEGKWEKKFLGNEVIFFSGLTYSPSSVVKTGGTFVLRSSNVKNGEVVEADNVYVDSEVVNCDNVVVGDIIVVVRNGSRSLIGKHAQIKRQMDNTVIGAFMTGIHSKQPAFINSLLDTNQFNKEVEKNLGATINQITTGAFKKMEFLFPIEDEQAKIGTFFQNLDTLITQHQKQLEKLKNIKKACLEKMFV